MAFNAIQANDARRRAQAGDKGFSLIEVMVALVISGLVLVGVFAFSGVARTTTQDFRRDVRIQQSLEGAMDAIGTDVRIAGLGFAQMCNEVRIWHPQAGRLINPSASTAVDILAGQVPRDFDTEEPFWVLRDGFQAHWRSNNAGTAANLLGDTGRPTSASPGNHADSFDVMMGEPGYVSSLGAFRTTPDTSNFTDLGPNANIDIVSAAGAANFLNPGNINDLNAVRQIFFPGSFILIVPGGHASSGNPSIPESKPSCVLMQVTGDVIGAAGGPVFTIPTGSQSGFNAQKPLLFTVPETSTWDGTSFNPSESQFVVPLGRLRWSRYEIDYTQPRRPFLVRRDIIGWAAGDPVVAPAISYPACGVNPGTGGPECQLPQLHLQLFGQVNGQLAPAPRTPIAPMIEDMQVAVGCDGYVTTESGRVPIPGYEEIGPRRGLPNDNVPNTQVDEYDQVDLRAVDEWLGNALQEERAPDCVTWGTAVNNQVSWLNSPLPFEDVDTAAFKMSPQTARVTLLGKVETEARGAGVNKAGNAADPSDTFFNNLYSIEDRPTVAPLAGAREYHTITEQFFFRNVTYRDPGFP